MLDFLSFQSWSLSLQIQGHAFQSKYYTQDIGGDGCKRQKSLLTKTIF